MKTFNEHYEFKFENGDYYWREGFDFTPEDISFAEANKRSMKIIADNYDKIYVAFSGGIDSEVLARILVDIGKPFEAVTVRFKYDINKDEIKHATSFCKQHNIKQHYIDVDVMEYMEHDQTKKFIEQYKIIVPSMVPHLAPLQYVGSSGYIIYGGGDCVPTCNTSRTIYKDFEDHYYYTVGPGSTVVHRYMLDNNIQGTPHFFKWHPQQAWSFTHDPLVQSYFKFRKNMSLNYFKYFKPVMFDTHYPGMTPRKKQTGFDLIEPWSENLREYWKELYPESNCGVKISVPDYKKFITTSDKDFLKAT